MWKLSLTVTFCPFLSSQPSHNPSEEDSQPFLPRSLAQKPQEGRIRWQSYAKAKAESGSKEHFPQTVNSWSRNKWECPAQRVATGARQDHRALAPTRAAPDTALSSPWHPWCRHCAVPGPCRRENVWGLWKSKAAKMLFLGYSKDMEGESLLVGCQGDSLWVCATVGSWCYLHFPLAQQARPRHSANLALDVQLEKALGTEGAKFLSKQNSSSACISFGTIGNFQAGEKSKIPHVEAPFPWIFIIIIFKNIFCTETLSAFFIQWKMTQSLCIM